MSDQGKNPMADERDRNPRGLLECEERPQAGHEVFLPSDPEQDDGDTIVRSVN
jgi:hypothetical protein